MFNNLFTKRTMHIYILIWILTLLIIISGFTMIRYFTKGEDKIPFQITKISTISTAQTKNLNLENKTYTADIMAINNIYISIDKNPKYKKDDSIQEITIDNFKILEGGTAGNIEFYRETNEKEKFTYNEENRQDNITYKGVQTLNAESEDLQILNQGGNIKFSIVFNDLGNIKYPDNENIKVDGTLLARAGISYDEIKTKISFDLKLKLTSGNNFYTNIILDVPAGNILQNGIVGKEYENINNLVFKRFK